MENEYGLSYENYDGDYSGEEYIENNNSMYSEEVPASEGDYGYAQHEQTVQTQQTVYTQPAQVITQPVITQPVIAQPIYTQPIYTQPIIMQTAIQPEPAEPAEMLYPAEPVYPVYPVQNYLPMEEIKPTRWQAPPILVFFALLLCFPVGLVLLLFFTKWGVFPKIFVTLFTLICIWFAYEILAFYTSFGLPSLLNSIFS